MLLIGIVAIVLSVLYKRYIPVRGVRSIEKDKLIAHSNHAVLVDLRDYNTSYKDKFEQALCLPLAYLNRHYQDIPNCSVILVASNNVEKNIASRFLRNKGFSVKGYYFM
ncbi:sulfurtransferase [Roseburia sp. 1XD42-34]|nr:sulfurtransferase [Roseburia sp. 1XD42-34]RKI78842.1 sulfurtransferase [Clostridium sp. 1xD42-85]